MKYKRMLQLDQNCETLERIELERLNISMDNKENILKIISLGMKNSHDPDIKGKSPDKFVERLLEGRFGNVEQGYFLFGKKDEEVICEAVIMPIDLETYHIYSFGVYEGYRKNGIGRKFLLKVINYLKERGVKTITLDVHKKNIPAMKLYSEIGFFDMDRGRKKKVNIFQKMIFGICGCFYALVGIFFLYLFLRGIFVLKLLSHFGDSVLELIAMFIISVLAFTLTYICFKNIKKIK